jgi:transposase
MEATSDYWKGVFYLLEAHGFEVWLVNARDVKHLPGRPKTDTLDAVWLCKVAERQMLRPSFVPPRPIRQLRDVARYRADLVAVRTAETQRVEKLLEDAQIKLSVVASDIFGVSGRAMLAALIQGERDPKRLAQLARTKLSLLEEAFTGCFTDQHAFLLAKMLARVDTLDVDLAELDTKLAELIAPLAGAVERLDEIPGIGQTAAHLLLAELGTDMSRFPTAGHLVSWAKFAPGVCESAGKRKGSGSTGHGNPYLARRGRRRRQQDQYLPWGTLPADRPSTRQAARHRGRRPVILVIVWHLLADPTLRFHDLGAGFLRHPHQR